MFSSVSQLDSFTDVFGDEFVDENLSQPLSLPTTCDTLPSSTHILATNSEKTVRPLKHTGQHGEFRSVEEIDPKYRCLFTYPYFNLVQSRIIEDALYSDKSLVVCAPTGSGKTVVFELAILQLLMQMEDQSSTQDFKIIYMAPVKAVCNERLAEWYPKLNKLGLLCIEVTGDTEVDFGQLTPYKVIITTPEKWDMLTRRWRDHRGLVDMIKLFLIDEVHILNDETRGPVLEAVVSRMKTVESAAQSAHRIEQLQQQYRGGEVAAAAPAATSPPRIRFMAVSATVHNPEDVAEWLGTSDKPAVFHKFGDECRPVKLQRIVEGYPCAEGMSIFKFDLILNYKLWPIIQKYYNGKPTLIFCNTRKSVALTAEALSREITVSFSPEQKAKLTALASTLKNKKLQMLAMSGVGCHHAGLLYEERLNIEQAFRRRDLPILVTTTTLAMGVNLPAHLVIVKNTQQYVNGAYQEYSMSTVLQMVGRAGRPQFDSEATAVIMTRQHDKPRYQALVGGSEPLQSFLHKRVAENLNSEAALGTVADVAQCVHWLRSTFLYVRAAKDPKRYLGLPPAAPTPLILKKIEELCVKAMNSLASSGLITMDEASCIESTEAGRLMSLFYMDVETMKNIMKIDGSETLERLLWLVCESHELSDMHLRMDERRCLNLLNRNNQAATIRFPMKGKITTRQMKLNCIIQATLGCLPIPEPSLNQEAMKVMRTASRVCKCLVKYVTRPELVSQQPPYFSAVLNAIVLSKCIEAHLWENSPYVSKQLKGIGPAFSALLASAGVTSFMLLEESHPRDLERIMNKGPPAGNIIRKQVSLLPKYQLTVTPIDSRSVRVHLVLRNRAQLAERADRLTAGRAHRAYLLVGDSENNLLLLTQFTDKDLIDVYDGEMKYDVTRKLSGEHKIMIHCVSSVIVGIDAQADYLFLDLEPQIPRDDHWSNSNISTKNVASKQTVITDVYREKKRKNDCDITQCKEKKKREYTLTQKLKALKECFGKTSQALKTDIDKSVTLSNKAIHDLLDGKIISNSPANIKEVTVKAPAGDLTKDAVFDPLEEIIINDDDDNIDDTEIDSILSKIESEISRNDPISKNFPSNYAQDKTIPTMPRAHGYTRPIHDTENVDLKYWNTNNKFVNESRKSVKDSKRHKNINMRSNYSFIDLIEKKEHSDDKDKIGDKSIDSGFSDAIKCQINKFLQQAKTTTKQTIPEIDKLIYIPEDEELPEVYVKSALTSELNTHVKANGEENIGGSKELPEVYAKRALNSETNTHVKGDGQDNIECSKSGNLNISSKTPSLRDNVRIELVGLSDENYGSKENLNSAEKNVKTAKSLGTSQYAESQEHTINMDYKKNGNVDLDRIQQDSKIIEENNDSCQRFDILPDTLLNANMSGIPTGNYNDGCEKLGPNSNIKRDKNVTVNFVKTQSNSSDNDAKLALVPYNYKIEAKVIENNNNRERARRFKSLIPWNTGPQNVFGPENTMVDKLRIPYQYDYQNVPEHIENYGRNSPNWVISNQVEVGAIQSSVSDLKPFTNNENLIQNNCNLGGFSYNVNTVPIVNKTGHFSDKKKKMANDQVKGYIENKSITSSITPKEAWNQTGAIQPSVTNLKPVTNYDNSIQDHCPPGSFSYNAPSVLNRIEYLSDTKHTIKHEGPKDYNNEENYFKKFSYTATKVDVCTKKYTSDHELRITRKLKVDVDITEVVKQYKAKVNESFKEDHFTDNIDTKAKQDNEITNLCEITSQGYTTKNENIKVTTKYDHPENVDARKKSLEDIKEKPEPSTANISIENILQKYSRILTKPETHTPTINKINKKIDGNTTVGPKTTDPSGPKSRKPFRISDIHAMHVPLPDNLTHAKRSAPIANPIEIAVPTVTLTKEETSQDLEPPELNNIDMTPKTYDHNNKSYESPVSVHSLKLDPLEDFKDDSMLNPKLLLQYFTEGSQDVTDIIAPPAPFSDSTSVYSPTMEDQTTKTGFYENPEFDVQYSNDTDAENLNNYSKMDNNASDLQSYPNEMETWRLSRDDTYEYESPVASVPWSQGAHSSRGFGSRRAKLCQFKFVRKKRLRH